MARKTIPVYYDDERDSDLLNFIDSNKGNLSRSSYVLYTLYNIKNNRIDTPVNKEEKSTNKTSSINLKTKDSFLKNIKKD